MNRKLLLMLLCAGIFLFGCSGDDATGKPSPGENNFDHATMDADYPNSSANSAEEDCPKDNHCSSPSCPLWKDLNSNNFCDLGE